MATDAAARVRTAAPTPPPEPPGGRARAGWLSRSTTALGNHPELLRVLSRPLTRLRPVVVTPGGVIVTGHPELCEVLARDDDFTVGEVNGPRMARMSGPFVLGMDRSDLSGRERSLLARCVRPGDAERIRTTVRSTAAELLDRARPAGRVDVVQDYARPAAARLVGDYLGVPGPDERTLMRWMRDLFDETFLNIFDDPAVRQAAEAAADGLHAYTDELVALRRRQMAAGEPVVDDFLTRLMRLLDAHEDDRNDEAVRRNIGGVIVGAVETTSKAVSNALDQLLRRPRALAAARTAALAGDAETVGRYAFEALRFNPLNPALVRHAARDVVLAAGTRRSRFVPGGRPVYLAILPAMFDPRVFDRPAAFRVDRPPESYLHFGGGVHACFGRYANAVQIPELVAALLRLDGLRRAGGHDGRIRHDGPFPDRFVVEFGDGRAR